MAPQGMQPLLLLLVLLLMGPRGQLGDVPVQGAGAGLLSLLPLLAMRETEETAMVEAEARVAPPSLLLLLAALAVEQADVAAVGVAEGLKLRIQILGPRGVQMP